MGLDMYLTRTPIKEIVEVAYWRKVNAIHMWFVKHIQNGVDDCNSHEVAKEQLEELLNTCKKVVANCTFSYQQIDDEDDAIPDNLMLDNRSIEYAKANLPTHEGFFFGSVEYDNYYIEDIKTTIGLLERIIQETDFDNEVICYQSSW